MFSKKVRKARDADIARKFRRLNFVPADAGGANQGFAVGVSTATAFPNALCTSARLTQLIDQFPASIAVVSRGDTDAAGSAEFCRSDGTLTRWQELTE